MSYLHQMYSKGTQHKEHSASESHKNPNRVAGGIRAQGVDYFEMLDENGGVKHVPSQKYVQSLEEQVKVLKLQTADMRKKQSKQDREIESLNMHIQRLSRQ